MSKGKNGDNVGDGNSFNGERASASTQRQYVNQPKHHIHRRSFELISYAMVPGPTHDVPWTSTLYTISDSQDIHH